MGHCLNHKYVLEMSALAYEMNRLMITRNLCDVCQEHNCTVTIGLF